MSHPALLLTGLALASLASNPASAGELQLRGLVVGVDDFESWRIPDLEFAVSDARRFRDSLGRASGGAWGDDNLPLLTDAQATREIVSQRVSTLLAEADQDTVVVLFFSSHGYVKDGQGYLYMHDTTNEALATTGLAVAELERWVAASPARHVLLFTDACHAASVGTLRGAGMPRDNAFNQVLGGMERAKGSLFNLASSLVQQKSYEGYMYCGGGGAFTCALSRALEGEGDLDGDGLVELAELSTWVQGEVMRSTNFVQTPEAKGDYDPGLVLTAPGYLADGDASAAAAIFSSWDSSAWDSSAWASVSSDEPQDEIDELSVGELSGVIGVLTASGDGGGTPLLLDDLFSPQPDESTIEQRLEAMSLGDGDMDDVAESYDIYDGVDDTGSSRWRDWWNGFRPWPKLGLMAGVSAGAVDPALAADGAATYAAGRRAHGTFRLGLEHSWWFHPGLELTLQDALRLYDDQPGGHTTRVGLGLREELHLFPYRLWDPYLAMGGGSMGGRWVEDVLPNDAVWRVDPLAGPWSIGGGVGLRHAPWWSGLFDFRAELSAWQLLGGEAQGTVFRAELGVELGL